VTGRTASQAVFVAWAFAQGKLLVVEGHEYVRERDMFMTPPKAAGRGRKTGGGRQAARGPEPFETQC
jgi:hypothetical protein